MNDHATTAGETTILNAVMPASDYTLIERISVNASAPDAYEAVSQLNLTDLHGPFVRMLFWLRALPELLRHPDPRRGADTIAIPERVLGSNWVLLGERRGREIVIGAAGRFWTPVATPSMYLTCCRRAVYPAMISGSTEPVRAAALSRNAEPSLTSWAARETCWYGSSALSRARVSCAAASAVSASAFFSAPMPTTVCSLH
jgi:hypothetical protein